MERQHLGYSGVGDFADGRTAVHHVNELANKRLVVQLGLFFVHKKGNAALFPVVQVFAFFKHIALFGQQLTFFIAQGVGQGLSNGDGLYGHRN